MGNCTFGGTYTRRIHHGVEAFVDSEIDGMWNKAQPVPRLGGVGDGCTQWRHGDLVRLGGQVQQWYAGQDLDQGGFVVSQTDGVWGTAERMPGAQALRGLGAVTAISCAWRATAA